MSPQERIAHRQKICFDVRVLLSAYFQPSEPEEIRTAQLAWWGDALEDWHHQSVVYALRQWNLDNPRLRPTPGDIVSLMKRLRGERMAKRQVRKEQPKPEEPNVTKISDETRAELNDMVRKMFPTNRN